MNPLPASAGATQLHRRLQLMGPVTVAEYMRLAMIGGGAGYYTGGEPLGAEGDFITAPEITQMFGELIGLWCIDAWDRLGRPDPFALAECGPGRGTLMADLLRAARQRPDFLSALRLHLIEVSEPLRLTQRTRLQSHSPTWHQDISTLPTTPTIILGNEFLDVFPVHQFERTHTGWMERAIAGRNGRLSWMSVAPGPQLGLLRPAHRTATIGEIAEVSPAALRFAGDVARQLAAHGGVALFIDYGAGKSRLGPTMQALRKHRPVDPLEHFGDADLSALVDFEAVSQAARDEGAEVYGPIPQGEFLLSLGIRERARRLSVNADDPTRRDIHAALLRLVDEQQMGTLFKAITIAQPGLGALAGFL